MVDLYLKEGVYSEKELKKLIKKKPTIFVYMKEEIEKIEKTEPSYG